MARRREGEWSSEGLDDWQRFRLEARQSAFEEWAKRLDDEDRRRRLRALAQEVGVPHGSRDQFERFMLRELRDVASETAFQIALSEVTAPPALGDEPVE